jgi:hypothetical protein
MSSARKRQPRVMSRGPASKSEGVCLPMLGSIGCSKSLFDEPYHALYYAEHYNHTTTVPAASYGILLSSNCELSCFIPYILALSAASSQAQPIHHRRYYSTCRADASANVMALYIHPLIHPLIFAPHQRLSDRSYLDYGPGHID